MPILVIGGGLSGLVAAILLSRAGIEIVLLEKKTYPFHKVCGEYLSNEVVDFLKSIDAYPEFLEPPIIDKLMISSTRGRLGHLQLKLGGFGVSRYALDNFLYHRALEEGAEVRLNTSVVDIETGSGLTTITTDKGERLETRLAVGAFGKRSRVDYAMDRPFTKKRAPFVGVKYHLKTDWPDDVIALHNFHGGYCGICKVEGGTINLCYLSRRDNIRRFGNIKSMEEHLLFLNPHLKDVFQNSDFVFDKPEVINEVSFSTKGPVENGVMMIGDSAGLITPLCGNGMAMAIHSAKLLAEIIVNNFNGGEPNLAKIKEQYSKVWTRTFATRLWVGRQTQNLFGGDLGSTISVGLMRNAPRLARSIIDQTHGQPF